MNDFLLHMKTHHLYNEFERKLLDHLPNIPAYVHSDDNTEEWKYNSAKREGFELCLAIFQIGVTRNDR